MHGLIVKNKEISYLFKANMHLNKLHLLKNQKAYQHKHPNNFHA